MHSLATLSGKPVHLHLAENQCWGSQGASELEAKGIRVIIEGVVNTVVVGGGKVSWTVIYCVARPTFLAAPVKMPMLKILPMVCNTLNWVSVWSASNRKRKLIQANLPILVHKGFVNWLKKKKKPSVLTARTWFIHSALFQRFRHFAVVSGFCEILLTQFGPLWCHYGPCLPVATSTRSQQLSNWFPEHHSDSNLLQWPPQSLEEGQPTVNEVWLKENVLFLLFGELYMSFICRGIYVICKEHKQPTASLTACLQQESKGPNNQHFTKPFLDLSQKPFLNHKQATLTSPLYGGLEFSIGGLISFWCVVDQEGGKRGGLTIMEGFMSFLGLWQLASAVKSLWVISLL